MIISRIGESLIILFIVILVLGPFYWIITTSFKPTAEIYDPVPTLFPQKWVLDHYKNLIMGTNYLYYLRNSTAVAIVTVVLTLIVSSSAAYALHRPAFPGKALLSRLILLSYMFPGILLLVPLYQMLTKLGLIDKLISLPLVMVAFTCPMSTWLLATFFSFIPREVEESALMDGASRVRVLTQIIIPLLKPGLAAVGIFVFVISWGEYMFASVFINSEVLKTLPVGLAALIDQYRLDWGLLAAGATAITVPVIILFALMGRRFVEGLISGAVKG
ncbi:MAG TPA: carbohydrate ABC transporter permease [Anaerolineae bacterium]|nr:carbohydrate ABC transporter permease [Anaerolineae bacterium]